MKQLIITYIAAATLAATASYASLASNYAADIKNYHTKTEGDWVYITGTTTGNEVSCRFIGKEIVAAFIRGPVGRMFPEQNIWTCLYTCTDRSDQKWVKTPTDKYGSQEWMTTDKRIYAKLFWFDGRSVLRICYAEFLLKYRLYDKPVAPHKREPKKGSGSRPDEIQKGLLPPIEETQN